jgi:hypothetical protein
MLSWVGVLRKRVATSISSNFLALTFLSMTRNQHRRGPLSSPWHHPLATNALSWQVIGICFCMRLTRYLGTQSGPHRAISKRPSYYEIASTRIYIYFELLTHHFASYLYHALARSFRFSHMPILIALYSSPAHYLHRTRWALDGGNLTATVRTASHSLYI